MRVAQWARLREPARCGLRWGAWYPVMGLTPGEAELWVRGRAMVVARSVLELRDTQPHAWTVARPPGGSDPYLVCPSCRHRAHLPDARATTLRCPRCNDLFTIAWDNGFPERPREQLSADHRMTRRRLSADRRSGQDRRILEAVEPRAEERRVTVPRRSGWDRRDTGERRRRATNW